MFIPKVYQQFQDYWQEQHLAMKNLYKMVIILLFPIYCPKKPSNSMSSKPSQLLRSRWGDSVALALNPSNTSPYTPISELPLEVQSPVYNNQNSIWLKHSNMVGINVRTVGSFWNVVKYALTLPKWQDAIHLLPIWEPGVVGSLYGMSSWNINTEFFSLELAVSFPHLNIVERQLKAVVNLLHVMGKAVGMDVIPHTDRFSEIVLANPQYFEWIQRDNYQIINHSENLHLEVQERILAFLKENGAAESNIDFPLQRELFFSNAIEERLRLQILFGNHNNSTLKNTRRIALMKHLIAYGYEPLPATMAPPYRGVEVDRESKIVDEMGLVWRDYKITEPQAMSRIFGPLTRYKLYERLEDNQNWEIDFSSPRPKVWEYVAKKYAAVQATFNLDFMRGDMSHVQMRSEGVPAQPNTHYDLLQYVKQYIQQQGNPHFGYFAETFLAHTDFMGYGDEIDHLEASDADSTLGDLQSTVVGSLEFLQRFRQYLDLLQTRSFAPNFTVMDC